MSSNDKNVGDMLAQSMIDILSDENYNKIFEQPKVKKAAAKEKTKEEILTDACTKLIEASEILDSIGLPKSAANVLLAAKDIMSIERPVEEEKADIVVSESDKAQE